MLERGNISKSPTIFKLGDIGLVKPQERSKIALRQLVETAVVFEGMPDIGES